MTNPEKRDRLNLYKTYYIDKQFERENVFLALRDRFSIKSALYPGSFVHLTPSFVFSEVVYVDSNKPANKFFGHIAAIRELIEKRKDYDEEASFRFIHQDYTKPLPLPLNSFDLLISHYAGVVSQACKKYLKPEGILLANNSHADAGVAFLDNDFELIDAVDPNRKKPILDADLGRYFIPKNPAKNPSKEELIRSGKGIGYTRTAGLYVFRRVV